MNVLLCVPNVRVDIQGWGALPFTGLAYVGASLKQAGHSVFAADLSDPKNTCLEDVLREKMQKHSIDMVCCGGLTFWVSQMKEIIDAAKNIDPEVITVIGGGLLTFSSKEAMTLIARADYGIIGEGELALLSLIAALENNSPPELVPGVICRLPDGELKQVVPPQDIADLDALPFPDYEGFDRCLYEDRIGALVSSRSCPFRCTFCSHSGGRTYRQRSMDNVFSELDLLVEKYGIKKLILSEELFSLHPERIREFCERVAPYNLRWFPSLRLSEHLTVDLLQLLKDTGCVAVSVGLESADDRILKSMRKGTSVALMERVLRDAKKVGIAVRGGFIFGDVNETMETVNTTCNWIRKNRDILPSYSLDCIRLFPGSPLYDYAVKNSFITDTVKHIQDGCPPINISKMSDEEYDVLRQEILLEMYNLAKSDSQEVFSLDASGKSYKVTIGCSECSAYNEYAITPEEVLGILAYPVSCKCCGYYYSLYLLHPYIDWIESKLQAMNAKDRCALKGLGAIGHQIMQVSNAFKTGKNSPVLIDANPKLQGVKIEGLPVQHPDEVDFSELDTIIICTVHFESIKKRLSAQHPHLNIVGFHQIGLMNV